MPKTAIEKFTESMNIISDFWTKEIEVVAQNGKIIMVKCDGFTWMGDKDEK